MEVRLVCETAGPERVFGTAVCEETLDGAGDAARGVGAPELPATEVSRLCSWLERGLGSKNWAWCEANVATSSYNNDNLKRTIS